MLKTLRKLLNPGAAERPPQVESRQLELAVACLLHESKRVDLAEDASEHRAACDALAHLFGTTEEDAEALLRRGREKAQQLTSYYSPLSVIKRDFSLEQRVLLVEHLWRIAYADGRLDPYEDHYVRKIAHLLYVPNTQTMLARSRARPA